MTGNVSVTIFSEIKRLRDCFDCLDDDKSGSIGWKQLKEPLIGLGLSNNIEEVFKMIEIVDDDKSGMIEFPEFLKIIRNGENNESTKAIT